MIELGAINSGLFSRASSYTSSGFSHSSHANEKFSKALSKDGSIFSLEKGKENFALNKNFENSTPLFKNSNIGKSFGLYA